MAPRICPICGRQFEPLTSSHKYCSATCRAKVKSQYNAQWAERRATNTPLSKQVRTCAVCGLEFTPGHVRQLICQSIGCVREKARRDKSARRASTEVCAVCGKKFVRAGASVRTTCSEVCRNALSLITQQRQTQAVGATGGRPTPERRAADAPLDFHTLQTLCPEFPSWDCPQMDPLTNRMEPAVWIDVPVAVAPRSRRAA